MSQLSSAVHSLAGVVMAEGQECIQENDILSRGLSPVINMFTGAVGGLLDDIVKLFVAVLLALFIAYALTHKASGFARAILTILLAIPAVIILIIAYEGLTGGLNTLC